MKNDRIYYITKQLFADSLKSILEKKSIDKITIKELCDECSFSRRTFYRHFRDMYDLVEWIYKHDINDKINSQKDFTCWKKCLLHLFNYFYINKDMTYIIIKFTDLHNFENFLYESAYKFIKDIVEQEGKRYFIKKPDVEFLINYYTLSFVSMLIQWMKNGMKDDTCILVDNIALVLEGSIFRLSNQ